MTVVVVRPPRVVDAERRRPTDRGKRAATVGRDDGGADSGRRRRRRGPRPTVGQRRCRVPGRHVQRRRVRVRQRDGRAVRLRPGQRGPAGRRRLRVVRGRVPRPNVPAVSKRRRVRVRPGIRVLRLSGRLRRHARAVPTPTNR